MLADFKEYLTQKGSIKPLYIPYYLKWVSACYTFLDVSDSTTIDNDQKDRFLAHLAKTHEDWQVKQADTALRLYNFFRFFSRICGYESRLCVTSLRK